MSTVPAKEGEAIVCYSEVSHRGDWYVVMENPDAILEALRTAGDRDMVCLTTAERGEELWLRAGQIDAIAAIDARSRRLDTEGDLLDERAELAAWWIGRRVGPSCEERRRLRAPR